MGNPFFRFKRFTVRQEGAAMKVGTDGVLIGAWAHIRPEDNRCLDIGTGTGLIALMLAQRTEGTDTVIDAVEIDKGSYLQASENTAASEWGGRINLFNLPVQDFTVATDNKYDHIVANPPYFVDSLLPFGEARSTARHTGSLTYADLLSCVSQLIAPDGIFTVIIPADGEEGFTKTAAESGLNVLRKCIVFTVAGTAPKRVMLELSRILGRVEAVDLAIEAGDGGGYTAEYMELTRDFYMKF